MTTLSILVRVCIWVLVLNLFFFLSTRLFKCSWASLSCALQTKVKLVGSCFCLFDAIVVLHAMDEQMFKDFLIGK